MTKIFRLEKYLLCTIKYPFGTFGKDEMKI